MNKLTILLISGFLFGCSEKNIEEFVFRETLQRDLIKLCGTEDKACVSAVKSQIQACMDKSNWRKFVADQDNKAELNRFTREFYACILDADGNPYFTPRQKS